MTLQTRTVGKAAKVTPAYRYRIGADENGLGPRLGPMLTTAVLAEVSDAGHATIERKARGGMKKRLGDSKALVSHGDIALAEAWARVLVEHTKAIAPTSISQIVDALTLEDVDQLKQRCPSHVAGQCWHESGEGFEAGDELLKEVRKDLKKLEASGVRILGVRSAIVCTKHLNDLLGVGINRYTADLHAMERLVLAFRERLEEDVFAVLGKVGGYTQYEAAFGPLNGRLCMVLEERRQRSSYRFPGVGELAFVMDADDSDRLVSIASLVGKYLREVLMARIVRHYQVSLPELENVSGYHDPVTKQFVDATRLVRRKQRIPDDCFERRSMASASASGLATLPSV